MSITRAQKVRLGIFVLSSLVLLLAALSVLIGGRLARKEDDYFTRFADSVSGLEIGAPVKFQGVRIGSVGSIDIDREDISKVRVTLGLRRGTPVKGDSIVTMNSMGITGLKFIELTGGTNETDFLDPGAEIPSAESFMDRITGKADVISEKIELLANNLVALTGESQRQKFDAILSETADLLASANRIVKKNEAKIDEIVGNLSEAAESMKTLAARLDHTLERLDDQILVVADEVQGAVTDVRILLQEQNINLSSLLQNVDDVAMGILEIVDSPSVRQLPKALRETTLLLSDLIRNADSRLRKLLTTLDRSAEHLDGVITDGRVQSLLDGLPRLASGLEGLVETLDLTLRQSREDLFKALSNLKDVVRNLNDFTQMLLENPSILLRGSQLKERKL
jgi:phospholipid/cholesterol/gamma-HCH transport system substrate-binding protein